MKANIGISIDLEVGIESRFLITANSGAGKSYAIRKFLEESNGKVQQIVLDLEGEFASLREKFDFVVFGKDGDVPINLRYTEKYSIEILSLGVSAIIDLYELKHYERIAFVKRFLDSLINAPKELWKPVIVVVDEAHIFCPESSKAESADAVKDLCTRGRKRGYCAVLATQRLSKLNKDAAAECLNKLIGRTSLDIDMKRAADELGFNNKSDMLSLRDLEKGQFYAFGPAINNQVSKFKVQPVQTTHPKIGTRIINVPAPTEKIKKVLTQLSSLPAQAEKELHSLEDYKKEVHSLRVKLGQAQKQQPVIDSKQISKLKEENKSLNAKLNEYIRLSKERTKFYSQTITAVGRAIKLLSPYTEEFADKIEVTMPVVITTKPIEQKSFTKTEIYSPKRETKKIMNPDEIKIGKCERAILVVLAQRSGLNSNKSQLGILTGYSSKSGGFNNSLGKLRSLDWVRGYGNDIQITEEGLTNLGEYEPLPTGSELQEYWLTTLPKAESLILKALIENYPDTLNKHEIGEQTGYSSNSGGFNNALGKLRTLELIKGYGDISASENLFE